MFDLAEAAVAIAAYLERNQILEHYAIDYYYDEAAQDLVDTWGYRRDISKVTEEAIADIMADHAI